MQSLPNFNVTFIMVFGAQCPLLNALAWCTCVLFNGDGDTVSFINAFDRCMFLHCDDLDDH